MILNIKKNDVVRIVSGVTIFLILSFAILKSALLFCLLAILIFALMSKEWFYITRSSRTDLILGLSLIFIAISSILIIRFLKNGSEILLWYALTIGSYDAFAMYTGKFIGGAKICPNTSPMKTWSGFFGGLYFASLFTSILVDILYYNNLKSQFFFQFGNIIPTSLIVILAHFGDYFESHFKRKYSIKDSGTLIPGHGGVLDRFDSHLFSAPFLLIMVLI